MPRYYASHNAQANGDHEVHQTGGSYRPQEQNRLYLGVFTSCDPAVREAKKTYSKSNGCFYCSRPCHTS